MVGKWEASTAMVANKDKTALIPMGALKETPPPEGLLEALEMGEPNTDTYEIYLGVPVTSNRKRYNEFIEHKYRKIKSKVSVLETHTGTYAQRRQSHDRGFTSILQT